MTSDNEPATSPDVHLNQEDCDLLTPVRRIPRPLIWCKRAEQLTVDNPIAGSPLSPRVWAPAFSYAMSRINNSSANDPVYRNPNDTPSSSSQELVTSSAAMSVTTAAIPGTLVREPQISEKLDVLIKSNSFQCIMAKSRVDSDRDLDRLLRLEQEIQRVEKDLPRLKAHISRLPGQINKLAEEVAQKTNVFNAISLTICETEQKSLPLRKERDELVHKLARSRSLHAVSPLRPLRLLRPLSSLSQTVLLPVTTSRLLLPDCNRCRPAHGQQPAPQTVDLLQEASQQRLDRKIRQLCLVNDNCILIPHSKARKLNVHVDQNRQHLPQSRHPELEELSR